MANILALEWDNHEARIAVARRRGRDVIVDHAFSVDLSPGDAGQARAEVNVGERIAAALAARRIGPSDALVAVGRSGIELRLLSLPPAPDEELPELVRFQAVRQFSALGDDWPLDFFPVDQPQPDMPRNVLAAAISPELVEQIQQNCEAAQLRLRRLVLRQCAAASLLLQTPVDGKTPGVRMLVDVLTDEADLTVTVNQTVVFMRTVRLPGQWQSPQQVDALLGEIRRTRAAAQNQLGGQTVEQVVIFGPEQQLSTLQSQLAEKLNLPTIGFDPFSGLTLGSELRSHPPTWPGRFAPLLGMLVGECRGEQHAIDFLHPRRKPEPPNRSLRYALAAGAAAAVVLAVAGYFWLSLRGLDRAIEQRRQQLTALDGKVQQAEKLKNKVAEIDRWVAGDVTWLDELSRLSTHLPSADKVRLRQMQFDAAEAQQMGPQPRGPERRRGRMRLEGYAREHGAISAMQRALRDENHHVFSDGGSEDSGDPDYPWRFDADIEVVVPAPQLASRSVAPAAAKRDEKQDRQP